MKKLTYRDLGRGPDYPDWLKALRGRSGAYVIREKGGAVLYVGESHTGRLYQTITRHFQAWSGRGSGFTASRYGVEVAVRLTPPPAAVGAQDNLICKLKPSANQTDPCSEVPF